MTCGICSPEALTEEVEVWGHMASHIDQIGNLTKALKTVMEVQDREPLEGDQVGALATAIERSIEDAASLFEACYYPDTLSRAADRAAEKEASA